MRKPIPTFETDETAEAFFDRADLADYDLSGGRLVRFELHPKDKSVSLRLPEALLDEAGLRAAQTACRHRASSDSGSRTLLREGKEG